MNERGKDIAVMIAVFLLSLGLYSLDWFNGFRGGVSTMGAERVLAGDLPYRDFWTMYAPGHFYLLALLFSVFGRHFVVEVISASVLCAIAACILFFLVRNVGQKRIAAVLGAAIFVAATYNTGYFKNLGSYPPAILLILVALNFIVLYYHDERTALLVQSGLATGAIFLFKHDAAAYTTIAVLAGLIVHHCTQVRSNDKDRKQIHSLLRKIAVYAGAIGVVVIPVLLYFAARGGRDMLQDLVVFSLTDFRYSRPETYPSLWPLGVFEGSFKRTLGNLFQYLVFALPVLLLILGLIATIGAFKKRDSKTLALGTTFTIAFLLHYAAAHVQINTHIISMSVYAALLGTIVLNRTSVLHSFKRPAIIQLSMSVVAIVWLLSISAEPAYSRWTRRHEPTSTLTLAKVAGIKLSPQEVQNLQLLADFVKAETAPDEKLFIGLHRHDVVVSCDVLLYFILDRASATRYQELHPAIADTAPIQQEIISDLKNKNVSLIVLAHLFSDSRLEEIKSDFLRHLPQVGATDLDQFVREHYSKARQFGPYEVWQIKHTSSLANSEQKATGRRKSYDKEHS